MACKLSALRTSNDASEAALPGVPEKYGEVSESRCDNSDGAVGVGGEASLQSEEVPSSVLDLPAFSLRVGMASERGPRVRNDDYCALSWESDFFAVSDGIGGAPYGDVMSRIACNAAIEAYDATGDISGAFAYANEQASRVSKYLGERSGATLLLAELVGGTMACVYAGDTMAYRLRGNALEPLMVPGRAPGGGNALDNAVGYGDTEPSQIKTDVALGDRLLLCTDGVWEYVVKEELVRMLSDGDNAPMIADAICRRAAEVGSDNSTCICMLVEPYAGENHRSAVPIDCADTPVEVFE